MIVLGLISTARWICRSLMNTGVDTYISTQAISITTTRMNLANGFYTTPVTFATIPAPRQSVWD